jgi:serine/threonine protein kinase
MEYCERGDLFELVQKHEGFPERITHALFKQVIDGVSFLHHKGVAH